MVNFINGQVFHKKWGEGVIVDKNDNVLTVEFSIGAKKLAYPEVFEMGVLTVSEEDLKEQIQHDINLQKETEIVRLEVERLEREKRKMLSINEKRKIAPLQHIAFKCNYCDGGASDEQIGFCGICSEKTIINNIEVRNYVNCSDENIPCRKWYDKKIDKKDIELTDFICYECKMLSEWKASAGMAKRDGKCETIRNAQRNSLCVLTTRDPKDNGEQDRYIFGLFIIDDIFEGDDAHTGYVRASQDSPYKIKLTKEEAHQVKFWDYYRNHNSDNKHWGTGLFRYLYTEVNPKETKNDIALEILKKVLEVKKGKKDEQQIRAFYKYFCDLNAIKI